MPTFGVGKSTVAGSPLYKTIAHFGTSHVLRRGYTLDKCASPAGLHPVSDSVTGHLRRLYDELKGPHERELPRDKFEEFLKIVQRDPKLPSWALSEKSLSFTFEQFLNCWWTEYSAAKRTIHREDKDLDKPISNYFISSSHNTYIEDGNQITGEAKALQYKKVLESGCRCVEIDVWDASEADEDSPERPISPPKPKSSKRGHHYGSSSSSDHWSFSSMVSWMKDQCTAAKNRSMSFPRSLQSKKSEASFKAKPPTRAKAIMGMVEGDDLDDSASVISSLLKHEPRVRHAYETYAGDVSLHEAIPFRTVCRTIKDAAFTGGNDLPVIISLEVHANIAQQEVMVNIMREEWGELLLDQHLPHCPPAEKQPTLRDLRNKILIKVKTGSQAAATATGIPVASDLDSASTLKNSQSSTSTSGSGSIKPPKRHICDSLKRLAIYTYSPGHFTSFDIDDAKKPAHIYSFGEEKVKALHRTEHKGLFQHNRHFLARTFPESLSSFLSSNPNYPTLFWRKGVQMVALNWQVWDTAMELNDAMFDHEQGWVLKPQGYRSCDVEGDSNKSGCDAKCQADVTGRKMDLTITVLAGQHVPTTDDNDNDNDTTSSSSNDQDASRNNGKGCNHIGSSSNRGRTTWAGTARVNLAAVNAEDFRPRVKCFLHVESPAERNPLKNISRDDMARKTRAARTEQPDWGVSGSKMHFSGVRHVVEEVSFVR